MECENPASSDKLCKASQDPSPDEALHWEPKIHEMYVRKNEEKCSSRDNITKLIN